MELDPVDGNYSCGLFGRRGKLEDLAEGVFINRHKATRRCMETRVA
jgi:hypothetical protein